MSAHPDFPPYSEDVPVSPQQLGIRDFNRYALMIDARSPHEYAEDHILGAVNLPVVNDEEFAEVGIQYKTDQHQAYLIGAQYSLRNVSDHVKMLVSRYSSKDRLLVYCFRGGKRSRFWADTLRLIGFQVDVLEGGWKRYRAWVRAGLDTLAPLVDIRMLAGATNCGKTRLLHALRAQGHQVLDLEGLAHHKGSLLGELPDDPQPTQKLFDGQLLDQLRRLDLSRPIWMEAESKKIGRLHLPDLLMERMRAAPVIHVQAPMAERVKVWREDYPHYAADPVAMVRKLQPLKPLVGGETLTNWMTLAERGDADTLAEDIMVRHYDPCYHRSTSHNFGPAHEGVTLTLEALDPGALAAAVPGLVALARG